MHEKSPVLKAAVRDRLGSRYAKRAREAGRLPAVVYGHGQKPLHVDFDAKETLAHIEKGEKVFRFDVAGQGESAQMLLLKDVQFDYLGDAIVHADFARVDLNERVRTRVHVRLKGEAKGLKSAGAILMHPTNELEIECRVVDLPDEIVLDISELELDQMVSASEVKLPSADMKLITDGHAIVAQIVEQKEQVVAEATTVAADAVAPEVIGEKERLEKAAADAKPGAKAAAPAKDAKAAPKK
jgi:large subunit ribosomal protein L25